jgi:tetratricopeptide (TPR) repeat protein
MGFHQDESITKAMQCVQMAFELEPESIDALRLQGIIQIALTGEARQGLQSLEKVLTMAPNDTEALAWASATAGMRGKPDAGIAYGEQLVKLESLVPLNYSFFAWSHFLKGDFARSLELSESVISKDSKNKLVKFTRAISLIYLGKKEEAAELIPSFESDQHLSIFDRMILVQIYGALGRREKVEATLTDECKASARRDLQYPWHIAVAWTMLGEYDEAIAWLTIAIDNGFAHYQFLETLDPFLEPLRGDSRFVALINRARAEALSCTQ